jgi:hypothetical protein
VYTYPARTKSTSSSLSTRMTSPMITSGGLVLVVDDVNQPRSVRMPSLALGSILALRGGWAAWVRLLFIGQAPNPLPQPPKKRGVMVSIVLDRYNLHPHPMEKMWVTYECAPFRYREGKKTDCDAAIYLLVLFFRTSFLSAVSTRPVTCDRRRPSVGLSRLPFAPVANAKTSCKHIYAWAVRSR